MRVVFFGTPEFAVPSLRGLLDAGHDVVAVVTQPDRPRGRSRSTLVPPPVKVLAVEQGLPVHQPDRPNTEEFLELLRSWRPDVGVVVAYGHILKPRVLETPTHGMINVHASILPDFRGAAPVQHALRQGLRTTGVSIMRMDAGMDSGPVLATAVTDITPDDTTGTLLDRLSTLGAQALTAHLPRVADGTAQFIEQDHTQATFAPKITRETAHIDWDRPGAEIVNLIRAMDPAPGAWTEFNGSAVKLFQPLLDPDASRAPPGTVVATSPDLAVTTADGQVRLKEVQPAGKARMTAGAWIRGNGPQVGARFT